MWQRHLPLITSGLFALIFVLSAAGRTTGISHNAAVPEGQVVIAAPVQLLMFAGDRYLAANLEAIRSATITLDDRTDRQRAIYRLRSHKVVTRLNPCHEDNYYLGNAVLTWDGLEEAGNEILRRAGDCRFWDEVPLFYYGFNEYFFYRNIDKARVALEQAAKRSPDNAAALRKLAIMITAEKMDDEQMALNYLHDELRATEDPKLKQMLQKRLTRLEGLLTLRKAQQRYKQQTGQALTRPRQLIEAGILSAFPEDPLGLGYAFTDGQFQLATRRIRGLEEYR